VTSDIAIRIRGEDTSGPAFESASRRMQRLAAEGRSFGSLAAFDGRHLQRQAKDFDSFSTAAAKASSTISQAVGLYAALEIRAITAEQAQGRLTAAQEHYAEATAQHGAASTEAADALRQLEAAQGHVEKTTLRGNIATVAAVAQVAALAAQAPAAARSLMAYATAARTAAIASSALQIAATGGLAAIALVGGVVVAERALRNYSQSADGAAQSTENLNAVFERRGVVTQLIRDYAQAQAEAAKLRQELAQGFAGSVDAEPIRAPKSLEDEAAELQQRIALTARMREEAGKLGTALEKQREQLGAVQLDQRLFEVTRAVQDLADAGNLPGLQALRDNLFGQLAGALGTERYKELADAVTIANNALSSLGKDRARGIEDSLEELERVEERQHQQAIARIEGEYRAKEAAIQREIQLVESLRQVKRTVEEEQRALGARVFRSSAGAFSNMGEFERIAHLVNARGGSLEDVHLMLGGISSLSMSGQARHALGLPNIPGLAEGGIVRATPGGTIVRLGEGGRDEAVVPLGRGNQGTGAVTVQLTQNFYGPANPDTVRAAAEQGVTNSQRRRASRSTI
jgi:hypothetical protein